MCRKSQAISSVMRQLEKLKYQVGSKIAVRRQGKVVSTVAHEGAEDYSSWLLPAVERALTAASITMPDVGLYAIAAGPGSFTGVRVGLTTVKAWSEVYARPIAAVSRLEALAIQ